MVSSKHLKVSTKNYNITVILDDLRSGINDWVEKVLKKKKLEMKKLWHKEVT